MHKYTFVFFIFSVTFQLFSQIPGYNCKTSYNDKSEIIEVKYFYWENQKLRFIFSDSIDSEDNPFKFVSDYVNITNNISKNGYLTSPNITFFTHSFYQRPWEENIIVKTENGFVCERGTMGLGDILYINIGTKIQPGKAYFKPIGDIPDGDRSADYFYAFLNDKHDLIFQSRGDNKIFTVYNKIDINDKYKSILNQIFYHLCKNDIPKWFEFEDKSDLKYLESFLKYLNKSEIRFMRNMLFAIYGYKFKDPTLLKEFEKFTWYSGINTLDTVIAQLTEYQHILLEMIMKIENGK